MHALHKIAAIVCVLPQVKDAVTLCEFFSWLEQNVPHGSVTEVSAADKLEQIKQWVIMVS